MNKSTKERFTHAVNHTLVQYSGKHYNRFCKIILYSIGVFVATMPWLQEMPSEAQVGLGSRRTASVNRSRQEGRSDTKAIRANIIQASIIKKTNV